MRRDEEGELSDSVLRLNFAFRFSALENRMRITCTALWFSRGLQPRRNPRVFQESQEALENHMPPRAKRGATKPTAPAAPAATPDAAQEAEPER